MGGTWFQDKYVLNYRPAPASPEWVAELIDFIIAASPTPGTSLLIFASVHCTRHSDRADGVAPFRVDPDTWAVTVDEATLEGEVGLEIMTEGEIKRGIAGLEQLVPAAQDAVKRWTEAMAQNDVAPE